MPDPEASAWDAPDALPSCYPGLVSRVSSPAEQGRDELGIVECASGDSVGLITLRLTSEEEGAREPPGSGDDAHGYPRSYGHDSDDEDWASAGEPVGDHDGPSKKATPRGSSTPRRFPRMCSLRVTPDGAKVSE